MSSASVDRVQEGNKMLHNPNKTAMDSIQLMYHKKEELTAVPIIRAQNTPKSIRHSIVFRLQLLIAALVFVYSVISIYVLCLERDFCFASDVGYRVVYSIPTARAVVPIGLIMLLLTALNAAATNTQVLLITLVSCVLNILFFIFMLVVALVEFTLLGQNGSRSSDLWKTLPLSVRSVAYDDIEANLRSQMRGDVASVAVISLVGAILFGLMMFLGGVNVVMQLRHLRYMISSLSTDSPVEDDVASQSTSSEKIEIPSNGVELPISPFLIHNTRNDISVGIVSAEQPGARQQKQSRVRRLIPPRRVLASMLLKVDPFSYFPGSELSEYERNKARAAMETANNTLNRVRGFGFLLKSSVCGIFSCYSRGEENGQGAGCVPPSCLPGGNLSEKEASIRSIQWLDSHCGFASNFFVLLWAELCCISRTVVLEARGVDLEVVYGKYAPGSSKDGEKKGNAATKENDEGKDVSSTIGAPKNSSSAVERDTKEEKE